ncbi:MAG: hypothetical protein HY092_02580 [Candidatus Kerfeldbacteria bacterium]|nr:hypothetical protein [Candidatus Kerfeldbacteria bacterium]
MADFRHYQPHRSSRAMPWRRWLVTLAVVVVVVLLGKAVFGGHKNNKKNSPTNSGGISLVTDNTNSPSANTNDASNTNSHGSKRKRQRERDHNGLRGRVAEMPNASLPIWHSQEYCLDL